VPLSPHFLATPLSRLQEFPLLIGTPGVTVQSMNQILKRGRRSAANDNSAMLPASSGSAAKLIDFYYKRVD